MLALFDRFPEMTERFLLLGLDVRDADVRHGMLWLADSHICHAKRLPAADESVAGIASTLGFSSSYKFCCASRPATGLAHGRYRQTRPSFRAIQHVPLARPMLAGA